MPNPISQNTRGWLFVIGAVIGVFSAVLGPLTTALNLSEEWTAVAVSFVGAVTAALSLLARANLSPDEATAYVVDPEDTEETEPVELEDADEVEPAEFETVIGVAAGDDSVKADIPSTGRHALGDGTDGGAK